MYKSSRQEFQYNNISYEKVMLLWRCHGICRTLAHLMSEAYPKPFQTCKMIRHIANPGIVKTAYSDIFRDIQGHSVIFSHVQVYWGTLRYIQELLRHIGPYSIIFRTLCNPYVYNRVIFRTLAHLDPRHPQKPVEHVRWSGIFRIVA